MSDRILTYDEIKKGFTEKFGEPRLPHAHIIAFLAELQDAKTKAICDLENAEKLKEIYKHINAGVEVEINENAEAIQQRDVAYAELEQNFKRVVESIPVGIQQARRDTAQAIYDLIAAQGKYGLQYVLDKIANEYFERAKYLPESKKG